jgi:hypothetical protein
MSMLDSVSGLIDSARRLRGLADSLGAAELKAQIAEELLRLHEFREGLLLAGGDGQTAPAHHSQGGPARSSPQPRQVLIDGDSKIFHLDADGVTETYDLHVDGPESARPSNGRQAATAPSEAVAPPAAAGEAAAASNAGTVAAEEAAERRADVAAAKPPGTMSDQERFALAEQRILELEPLHHAALRKMNDLLTEDQRRTKAEATRAFTKAGRRGRELQQAVMAALRLTPEQQQAIVAARKELLDVRQAIARQVEGLLSKEQLERMLQQFAKRHG